jgi:hypothetical protein
MNTKTFVIVGALVAAGIVAWRYFAAPSKKLTTVPPQAAAPADRPKDKATLNVSFGLDKVLGS